MPVDQTPSEIWKDYIEPIRFYHGTSTVFLEAITRHGLSPRHKIYPAEYEQAKQGLPVGYFASEKGKVYISTDFPRACEYAMYGPEGIKTLLDELRAQPNNLPDTLSTKLRTWAIAFYQNHRPALGIINSTAVHQYLHHKRPLFHAYLTDQSYFAWKAEKRSQKSGYPAYLEAHAIVNHLEETLADFPTEIEISPQDIHFVVGNAFWDQYEELRTYGKAITDFLSCMNSQPPQLIDVLGGVYLGYYKEYTFEDLSRLVRTTCQEIEISEIDAGEILKRLEMHCAMLKESSSPQLQ